MTGAEFQQAVDAWEAEARATNGYPVAYMPRAINELIARDLLRATKAVP